MEIDYTPHFEKYEALAKQASAAFDRVAAEHSDCVRCELGCSDCCHALFDLTLIEAIYINHRFNAAFGPEEKARVLDRANKIDRQIYKIKRKAYGELTSGKDETEILAEMAEMRVRCPFLDEDDQCILYDHRPITCRLYGIPTQIGDKAHTCGKSGFVQGSPYPTANLDVIVDRLYEISKEFVAAIASKHKKMGEILVPLSMAILTSYDENWLGTDTDRPTGE